jgi:RNA polymerase sigma-70 factor (ECF subfamily)
MPAGGAQFNGGGEPSMDAEVNQDGTGAAALAAAFAAHRERLRRLVRLRLDPRLHRRIDESDVLQEAFIDIQNRYPGYAAEPAMPLYLWMRFLTVQRLAILHRHHLRTRQRDPRREAFAGPAASSVSLAQLLLGRSASISRAAMRAELQARLREALDGLEPLDREVLVLRHFEELTNAETAAVLGLQKTAASNRYVRALKRLREAIRDFPGLWPDGAAP